ncbi:MAG: hypothetical protein AAB785_01365 [Patescibacteria group bacterium]
MPNLHEIIQQIQKDLYCPVCGQNYQIGEIKLKGLFDQTIIIQTICRNGHLTLFMTTFSQKIPKTTPLNTNHVLELHRALEKFDGDFQKLWSN